MPNHVRPVALSATQRGELERRVRSATIPARDAQRARIALLAAEGRPVREIAELVGVSEPTVTKWRTAFRQRGVAGLVDAPRSGRPPVYDAETRFEVWWKSQLAPPPKLGITHWSSRAMAREFGMDDTTIVKWWQEWDLKPWLLRTCKQSTDPAFEAKLRDVVGLYVDPPDKAIVLWLDEKSEIQALDRTQPMLPVRPGLPAGRTHDYKPRHRNGEFLRFLKQVAKAYPRRKLHIVVDNYSTHKHANVEKWLSRNPRITLHFTPTSGSWLNLVECFFSIITRQAIHRGTFGSVDDLITAIDGFITAYNDRCNPFVWTKSADELLAKVKPEATSSAAH